jgi:hypothetical protein
MLPPDGWQLEAEMYSPVTNKKPVAALIVISTPGKSGNRPFEAGLQVISDYPV